ncbi:reverse transcriptase domain-containing protein [Thalassobellus citreus]|uniref:RNA-directed DNA polymerase n=1 Tax=Thalassobellus citreus TaxID=3367752 RepID=UPI0037A12190
MLETHTIPLTDLFIAYYNCRKNKRNTINALAFELNLEEALIQLKETLENGTYTISSSIAFVVDKPVKREIFAANFRDRVVHHLLIQKMNGVFEQHFIYDSYACRKAKGTHFGIGRVDGFIRKCSKNYKQDCYVLKLDIKSFFMHINKAILYNKIETLFNAKYNGADKQFYLKLCKTILFNNPVHNAIIKGSLSNWDNLPKDKSLFAAKAGYGLPIGNLTSQVFANVYMSSFDHFIKHQLGVKYYGRYVDDFVLVNANKAYLKNLIPVIAKFLKTELHLKLHPQKIYLQHYSKGVSYIGGFIKPNRIYVSKRTKGNFYEAIHKHNKLIENDIKPNKAEKQLFLSNINSYLGILTHFKSHKLRRYYILKKLSNKWMENFIANPSFTKLTKLKKNS